MKRFNITVNGVTYDVCVEEAGSVASAPVAATTTMFAAKFDRDVDLSVGLVSSTTLLSIITMPIIIALAQTI